MDQNFFCVAENAKTSKLQSHLGLFFHMAACESRHERWWHPPANSTHVKEVSTCSGTLGDFTAAYTTGRWEEGQHTF